jgi:hypothetical protein
MDPNMAGARRGAALDLVEEMEDPRAEGTTSPEVMIPSSMFPKGCKEGATVTISGTVGKMGNKVGFTPTSVAYESKGTGDAEGATDMSDSNEEVEA